MGINGTLPHGGRKRLPYIWLGVHGSFPEQVRQSRDRLSLRSLRQRRGERGHVHPGQPSERGHPAQLHQHLQRCRLRLRRPRCVQRSHHIEPEHRGEPGAEGRGAGAAAAARQLMVLKQGGVLLPVHPRVLRGKERVHGFSSDHLFLIYFWRVIWFLKCFLCDKWRQKNRHFRCKL